jgi:hypothetical protein
MKPKKPSEQQTKERLRKKCVKKAKEIAGIRDNWKCQYCGLGRPQVMTHGSHIKSEGMYKSMSADPDNILTLCWKHHIVGKFNRASNWNWHGSPKEAVEWFKEKYPVLDKQLEERARKTQTCDLIYWQKKWNELNKSN